MIDTRGAVVILDMVLLIMTASWIPFGISQGIDTVELVYNYIYIIIAVITLLLNIKLLHQK